MPCVKMGRLNSHLADPGLALGVEAEVYFVNAEGWQLVQRTGLGRGRRRGDPGVEWRHAGVGLGGQRTGATEPRLGDLPCGWLERCA